MTYMFAVACTPHKRVVFNMFETTHMHVRRTCAMNVYIMIHVAYTPYIS